MCLYDPGIPLSAIQGFQTTGPLFSSAIQTILAAQCLVAPELFGDLTENEIDRIEKSKYDFIIVGAGTAGSLVANRILQEGWKVLLLEAGGNPTLGTEIPALFINNYGTKEDWNYRTEPQKKACLNYKDQKCYWPRGKVLGGTSSINGMYYIIGNRKDYDEWNLLEWKYKDIEKYFVNKSNIKEDSKDNISLEYNSEKHDIEEVIIQADKEIGVPFIDDLNGIKQIGVGIAATTTKDGQRHSSLNAFLNPVKDNKNLTVIKGAYVQKIIIDKNTAVGVEFYLEKYNKTMEVRTKKEVILSAGTINSVQILWNSGIGPEKYLKEKTKVNLPVGQNLQDHIFVPIMFQTKCDDNSNSLSNIFKSFYDYFTLKTGPLSDLRPQRVVSFINTIDEKSDVPDIQNHFIVVYPNQSNIVDIFVHHRFSKEFYDSFNNLNKEHLIIIVYVTLLQPVSKGEIIIDNEKVKINANYLDSKDDLDTLIRGIKHAIKLKDTQSFKKAGFNLHWMEIEPCKGKDKDSDDHLDCIARQLTGTLYHAVGTNKMGKSDDPNTVVDEKLLVKNVDKLRIIDASVMPKIVRGNTMAATLMIAEKGVEYIKDYWTNC